MTCVCSAVLTRCCVVTGWVCCRGWERRRSSTTTKCDSSNSTWTSLTAHLTDSYTTLDHPAYTRCSVCTILPLNCDTVTVTPSPSQVLTTASRKQVSQRLYQNSPSFVYCQNIEWIGRYSGFSVLVYVSSKYPWIAAGDNSLLLLWGLKTQLTVKSRQNTLMLRRLAVLLITLMFRVLSIVPKILTCSALRSLVVLQFF